MRIGIALKPAVLLSLVSLAAATPQGSGNGETRKILLTLAPGTPLRLYLTKRVSKRYGAPVDAKLLNPLYSFDREVVPAGTEVLGRVSRVQPVAKWERIRAVLGGDFTLLRIAQIEFTSLRPGGGASIDLRTVESPGLDSLVPLRPPKQRAPNAHSNSSGIVSAGKQKARDAIDAKLAGIRSIPDMVRSPGRKEWLYDYAMSRLPCHPQYVRNRTRFDAELESPLDFGSETVALGSLALLGSQPPPGSIAHARLLTPLDSMGSKRGDKVEGVLDEPLFSSDRRVILPEGTMVHGSVSMAKKAGWFHRGGRLRFDFQNVDLTPQAAELAAPASAVPPPSTATLQFRTQATLNAAESGNAPLSVDKEGGVQAKESKKRFIGTALALLAAGRASDNDPIHAPGGAVIGHRPNVGGRALGGGIGFGILGSIAAQSSRRVGVAFGYYGLAWSVYSTVVARGAEVQFAKDAVIDIGFNQRAREAEAKK